MSDITNGLRGLTFEGALDTRNFKAARLDNLKETGEQFPRYENEASSRFRQVMQNIDEEDELLRQLAAWRPTRNQRMLSQQQAFLSSNPSEDIGLEAAASGFGESRFDRKLTSPAQIEDLEDSRARQQSTLGVLANSVAKMGVLAATTAADSWIGLPAGLINLISDAASGNIHSGSEAFNALVNNPVSAYLQNINEKSEEYFRNYETAEERNRPWWENMFTANFIGDTLIKNAGFTIGAVIGARGAVGVLGKMTGAREARDAFKGLSAELGMAGKNPSEILEMLAKGTTKLEKQAAVKALGDSARKLKNAELSLQIAGGLIAGTGEARIEALNGVSELEKSYEDIYGNIDLERAKALNRIKDDMQRKGIDINTEEGKAYYEYWKGVTDERFVELQDQIAHDKILAANTIFALNVPLLTFGDVAQWGKLMLGGYAIDRSLVNGIKKTAEKSALRNALTTPEELIKDTRYAVKGNKFTNALGKVGAGGRNVFIEAQEEMNQSFFSATAKAKAMGNTTEFLERLYDPMAVADTVSWLDAAKEGMRQSWLNKDDWVEGFAGGFMGFMGLPSISVKVDEKTGKRKPKVTMEGGVWSPVREYNDLEKRREELVQTLNNRLASPEFLNYYYGRIGNAHFDSIKEDAVKTGNKKLYQKADHAQLINDAMTFAKAGRLQDFLDIIDSFQNVSDGTIESIKQMFPESNEVQKMTTSGMRTLIDDNVDRMKRQLDNYMKIADNIKTVYGNTIDDATAAELTWQTAHLDEIENDLKEIMSHTETTGLLAEYRSAQGDKAKDLTDYELVSSGGFLTWLQNKYRDKKDPAKKSDLEKAMQDAEDARYDMSERGKYIDNISALSSDPELVQKRMSRALRQKEELMRLNKLVKAAQTLSSTSKLSEFIVAMEDLGEDIPEETLKSIKKEADNGNVTAAEYLMAKDIDSDMAETIQRIGEKSGATAKEIQKAKDAWNYFKHNSDTAFDLVSKKKASDIAPDIAGEKSINLLNEAVESILKNRKLYDKIKERAKKKPETKPAVNPGESTKFKTTGKTLTQSKFDEIAKDLNESTTASRNVLGSANIVRIDLDKGDFYYDGKPASGFIYLYYPNSQMHKGGESVLPVVYDANGNEVEPDEVKKLTNKDGLNITDWIEDDNFPALGKKIIPVIVPKKAATLLPIGKKKASSPKPSSTSSGGKSAGKKTSPHKFIAPNTDMSLLGGDSHAVAELLKSLPEGAEVRFGIEEKDGPIYILAGDSNMKIGTLPRQDENSDSFTGLSELDTIIRQEYAETSSRINADGMWISENYVNHIREKRESGFETIDENIPIGDIPGFDGIKEPILMLVYDEGGQQQQAFSSDSVTLDNVQLKAGTGAKELTSGFVYLLVPSGKDKYIPVMLYTQNVNEETFNLHDPAVTASGFGKRISDTIDKVVEAITTKDAAKKKEKFRFWALNTKTESSNDSLQRLLYFKSSGKSDVQFYIKETCQHQGWFGSDDVIMVINQHDEATGEDDWIPIIRGKKREDGSEYSIRDQIIDTISNLKYQTESGEEHNGPIAQINVSQFRDKKTLSDRVRELVDAKMLLTDVKDFDLSMPSFIMDYWSVSQKKFIRPSHPSADKKTSSTRVSTKKTKTGTQKVFETEVNGETVGYNMSTGEVKIGSSKWFDIMSATKTQNAAIKNLGFKDARTFARTVRALAVISSKYGENTTGDGRIGDRVLLKGFTPGKDEGFIITGNGGRFMTADELVKFKADLKSKKTESKQKAKDEEAKRVKKVKEEEKGFISEDEFEQSLEEDARTKNREIARIEKVHTMRQAIDLLRKNAPQYAEFLDHISDIGYYDDILIELVDIVDPGNKSVVGRNTFKFDGTSYTDAIKIGRNAIGYHTLMHEIVHAYTVVALKYDSALRDKVQTQMDYMRDSLGDNKLRLALGANGMIAFRSPQEFIAEFFSNPSLQALAKKVEMPQTNEEKSGNVFVRFIKSLIESIKSYLTHKKKDDTFYDNLYSLLSSVVDRQAELHEMGRRVFKSEADYAKAKSLASGAKVDGVAMSTKIPTVEEDYDYRYAMPIYGDRSEGVIELHRMSDASDITMVSLAQLLDEKDQFSSNSGMNRLIQSGNVYEYNNGTMSSVIGVKSGDIFIAVRALPVTSDESYSSLLRSLANSKMPVVISVSPEDVDYYTKQGMLQIGSADSKIFVANNAFTNEDLYTLGTTYRPFADVLDSNSRFIELRKERYSDDEWDKMSEMEKYHARKCIGL